VIGSSYTWRHSELEDFKVNVRREADVREMIPDKFLDLSISKVFKNVSPLSSCDFKIPPVMRVIVEHFLFGEKQLDSYKKLATFFIDFFGHMSPTTSWWFYQQLMVLPPTNGFTTG
jgi:hypothetical protein